MCVCVCINSRHGHVAAIYNDVPQIWISRLICQVQGVGSPQGLVETSQSSYWWGRGVIRRRGPGFAPLKTRVADGLIGRDSVYGLS